MGKNRRHGQGVTYGRVFNAGGILYRCGEAVLSPSSLYVEQKSADEDGQCGDE
jgi:hypothetical protein